MLCTSTTLRGGSRLDEITKAVFRVVVGLEERRWVEGGEEEGGVGVR